MPYQSQLVAMLIAFTTFFFELLVRALLFMCWYRTQEIPEHLNDFNNLLRNCATLE